MVPEGWVLGQVSDVCRFQNGYGFTPPVWDTQGLPIIRIQNLNGSKNFNYFSGDPDPKWIVEPGQMLFAWAGTKGASFGPTVWQGETGVLNQHIFKVFESDGVSHDWLHLVLRHVTDRIETKAHGFKATLVHVKKSDIERQPIHIPPLPEQRKIADILSTWDRAIEVTEALLATARTQKRALMQSLLTGKRRFPEFEGKEWIEVRMGDVAYEVSERNKDDADYTVISCTKTIGFVNSLDYFKKQVFSEDLTGYKIIRRNQIGYPSNHVEEGSIGIQNLHDAALVSPIYTIFETGPEVDPHFLFRVLKTDRYRQMFAAATNASVDRRGSLRWKAFSTLKLLLPSMAEQIRINQALQNAEEEVVGCEAQVAKLRAEKKALMQQLLTGKRRVVV
ncbi:MULTISPECIES: restriction endonuclease subunit S [unclassified Phaeobacter]|uniref:restriction endonuclease subunit S n=1 Tax=unclassified Phaeobacter TaxID=2621772 RepID=UPI003A8701DB